MCVKKGEKVVYDAIHFLILYRLGLANKQQCESALKQTKYDVEMAASLLLDQAR